MEYRQLPHGNERISVIGLGMAYLNGTEEEVCQVIDTAIQNGVNFFDLIGAGQDSFVSYARAFSGRRSQIYTQMHFGAVYENGKYGWSRDLDAIKRTFEWELKLFQTDYTDFGFVHCIDELSDWEDYQRLGIWDYIKEEKAAGRVHHIGFSSHNPHTARKIIETGLIDLFMFSINPAYDYQKGSYGIGEAAERAALYRDCEKMGIGISVMKPFGGGQLLDGKTSPFKRALTKNQCIQYALDRPAVMAVLPGVRNLQDLTELLQYNQAAPEEKDYSVIGQFTPQNAFGNCVYCNHCQPCPAGLNVGLINKYYDLAKAGDEIAVSHYENLNLHASDCISCGHCESRCPFRVPQVNRMEEIAGYFGR